MHLVRVRGINAAARATYVRARVPAAKTRTAVLVITALGVHGVRGVVRAVNVGTSPVVAIRVKRPVVPTRAIRVVQRQRGRVP